MQIIAISAERKGFSLLISVIFRVLLSGVGAHGQLPSSFGRDVLGEPVHAFVESFAAGCIRRLDLPFAVT